MSTSLPTQQNLASLRTIENDPRYGFCKADIRDRKTMSALVHESRPDAVLHLAVESHVDRSIDGPAEFIKTNVEGTFVLAAVALACWQRLSGRQASRFRFHHDSTDEVFG